MRLPSYLTLPPLARAPDSLPQEFKALPLNLPLVLVVHGALP